MITPDTLWKKRCLPSSTYINWQSLWLAGVTASTIHHPSHSKQRFARTFSFWRHLCYSNFCLFIIIDITRYIISTVLITTKGLINYEEHKYALNPASQHQIAENSMSRSMLSETQGINPALIRKQHQVNYCNELVNKQKHTSQQSPPETQSGENVKKKSFYLNMLRRISPVKG